jgi:hypothetical protein
MISTGSEIITKLQTGEAPFRSERQSIHCNANGGYVVLSFNGNTATIDFDDNMSAVEAKLSALVSSAVSIVEVDDSISNVCDPAGKHFFIEFPVELGDVAVIEVNLDALQNGVMAIHGNGEGQHGAVDGISPIMGYFTLSHDGVPTVPIAVDASAEDVRTALENLPSIGSVSVAKDLIGIRRGVDGDNLVPGTTSQFGVWSVTFADDREDGCHPGSWDKCPMNIGDVSMLEVDSSLVSFEIGASQQQSAPTIDVTEVRKGSTGNSIVDPDQVTVDFTLSHDIEPGVGIDRAAVHILTCAYSAKAIAANDPSGSFHISVFDKRITVNAQSNMSQLKNLLRAELSLVDAVSTAGSSYGTVCRFDANNPVTAVTKLTFSSAERAFPEFVIESADNVIVSSRNTNGMIDEMQYIGDGVFRVEYTPKISGLYSAAIKINGEYLWTDLSAGVIVDPTFASARHSTHDSKLVALAGAKQSFDVVLRDRFGNLVESSTSNETSVLARFTGVPHHCNDANATDEPVVAIQQTELSDADGHYEISYTPLLAGQYQASVMMRSQGGLLATYFKNQDLSSQPVYGNFHYSKSPDQAAAWCIGNDACDSTLLDSNLSFSWGFDSPLPSDPSFPVDSFSIMWVGELKVDVSDEYFFTIKLNGGARLIVGETVVIDALGGVNAESISSREVVLMKDTFYPIKVEYSHFTDEASIELLFKTLSTELRAVPSSALYFSRHVEGSPFSVQVSPSLASPSSIAQGKGLDDCVALQECLFVVYTKDEYGNSRFNDGSSPNFEINIVGSGGWAQEGRVNSVIESSGPLEVLSVSAESNHWEYIGQVDGKYQSHGVASRVNMLGLLSRGDSIVIDGVIYTISSTGTFDEISIPLSSSYLGETKTNIPLYKASKTCRTGTHTIKYTPEVRGSYEMDIKLPKVSEVQRIITSVLDGSSLSGTFALNYGASVSTAVEFDSTPAALKAAIESMEGIGSVDVSIHQCNNPSVSCSWDVTFVSFVGDVITLLVNKQQLIGVGADVRVEELIEGKPITSITGFPRTVEVSPGETSPLMSTAYGSGLVTATAGRESTFTIQAKDLFGNDRQALQAANLFSVHVYPEVDDAESYHIIEGSVTRSDSGEYDVKYTPVKSGFHTVAIALSVSMEQQVITTGYNTKARAGTFKIILNKKPSRPIPWDSDAYEIAAFLDDSFGDTSTFEVEKQSHGLFNYKYIVSFKSLIGDAPLLVIDTSNLVGNANAWEVDTTQDGKFSHIRVSEPQHEVQRINLEVDDPLSINVATFFLTFMGRRTEPIPWDAGANDLKARLQKLATVGDISVSSTVDGTTNSRNWLVTFDPYEGQSSKGLFNFGNLPSVEVSGAHDSISVDVETVQNGQSPFRALVLPGLPSNKDTTAYDYSNVDNFEGLSTGTYQKQSHFYLQARDENWNEVVDGPLNEVQIIETSAYSNIGGRFEVTMFGHTRRFDASSFISDVEKGLQTIPGVGSVSVTSNSAKDQVIGKTAAVTRGLSTITPSAELIEFEVGDWIRVGDRNEGQLFSIVALSEVHPFIVTLSSPYLGETDESASIYQHGTLSDRRGYQYIVSFDSTIGDIPKMLVDGTLLEGDGAKVEVTSCDWNLSQSLHLHAPGPDVVDGYFYLKYGHEETRLLSVDSTAQELMDAITTDIMSIRTLSVVDEQDYSSGGKSWTIRLQSVDGDAELFFAEGHLIRGGSIAITNICPEASRDESLYRAESVAGRKGGNFVLELNGSVTVRGRVDHDEDGKYLGTYVTPRAGDYSLSVLGAAAGGLTGEYFKQTTEGSPLTTRVDSSIDLQWNSTYPVLPDVTGAVIRWTGYIKPSFDEVHTFSIRASGGVRMWIGEEILIDEYENESEESLEFSGSSTDALVADQLVSVRLEYRPSRVDAMIQLLWQSVSQPLSIIDHHRLFFNASHIAGSPFTVSPQSIKPGSPEECKVNIAAWNELNISWSAPEDDGGDVITKYLVESWDANQYGLTEKQQLRMKQTITGGTFAISVNGHTSHSIPVSATALELEETLQSLPNVGDVSVAKSLDSGFVVYDIEFLTNTAPVSVLDVNLDSIIPDTEREEYCVCAKGGLSCHFGSSAYSCEAASSREGSVSTSGVELVLGATLEFTNDESRFSYIISDLEQSSTTSEGFGVRVSAGNDQGYGVACQSQYLKPFASPNPPTLVEMARIASSPSSLAVHFTSVTYPDDRASTVSGFFIEWSTTEDFLPGTVWNMTVDVNSVQSERLSTYNSVGKDFNTYTIQDLDPGNSYFVRVAAINQAGAGPSGFSTPLSLAPGSKPSDLDPTVTIQTLDAVRSAVAVKELCSSLHVSWHAPVFSNGFDVSNYLVEYWVADGVDEVQEISLASPSTSPVRGTFTLGYGHATTDSLSIDSTAEDVKVALESLSTIRSVKVWRSGSNPNYTWTVTFLAEFPSIYGSMLKIIEGPTKLIDNDGAPLALQISVLTPGSLPIGYNTQVVTVDDPQKTHYTLILDDLTPGQPYHVQVSAANSLGYGRPQLSVPRELAPPVEKPSAPTNVIMRVVSSQALDIIFSNPESDGGDDVTLYRIDWDTGADFDGRDGAPLGTHSFVPPRDEIGCDPCIYQINGLIKGVDYFVRVYAYNSRGYSLEPGVPSLMFLSPKTTPDPPANVYILPQSGTELKVAFGAPIDNGGAMITGYKIAWNAMGYQAGMNSDAENRLYSQHNVQSITLTADADDIGGTFRIAFTNFVTDDISVHATAHDMKLAIESIPPVGSVIVTRKPLTDGIKWAVTFLTNLGHENEFGPIPLLEVSADPNESSILFASEITGYPGSTLLGTGSKIVVAQEVTAFGGFEQQMLTAHCSSPSGILAGYFTVSHNGRRTNNIAFDSSAETLKQELEALHMGAIKVLRQIVPDRSNSFKWTVIWMENLGNVKLLEVQDYLTCTDGSARPFIFVTEVIQGQLPHMQGLYSGFVEINASDDNIDYVVGGLMSGMPYHIGVSAKNEVGYGSSQYSTPAVMVPMDHPEPPTSVELRAVDNSTLDVRWNDPLSKHQVTKYEVDLFEYTGDVFMGSFEIDYNPEVQAIILETSANDMSGYFYVSFMGESTGPISVEASTQDVKELLEGISTVIEVDVSNAPHSIGSTMSYGQKWEVTFLDPQGNLPSMLVSTGLALPSTIAAGGSLSGSSPVVRVQPVSQGYLPTNFVTPPVLDKAKLYTARVRAFNGHAWSLYAETSYAMSPSKTIPSPPREVKVNIISDTEIGVSWEEPLYSGGDFVAGYTVQWDDDVIFDMASANVKSGRSFVIENLDPFSSYYVRVMAYTARGYSDPVMAQPLLASHQELEISLISPAGPIDYTETFQIAFNSRVTEALSVIATAAELENALNSLGLNGAVSVDREDYSEVFDSSSIETDPFSIHYLVRIFGLVIESYQIIDDNLGNIVGSIS